MVFTEVNRVYLGLVERWNGALTILRALSKTSNKMRLLSHNVTTDVTQGATFSVGSKYQLALRLGLGSTPNPATRPLVPRGLGNPRRLTAASHHIYLPLGVRSGPIHTVNLPLTREIRIFNLRSREFGHRKKKIESKCTAKIKYRGPGIGRCVRASATMRFCYSPKASLRIDTECSRGTLPPDSRVQLEL